MHCARRFTQYTLIFIMGMAGVASLHAAPMGYNGSWMFMTDARHNFDEVFVNYALTPRDAIGVSRSVMRSDDYGKFTTGAGHAHHGGGGGGTLFSIGATHTLSEVTYTRLVHRWNLPEAQANIWFIGGIGELRTEYKTPYTESSDMMVTPGIQLDYETTRVFVSGVARLYRAEDLNNDMAVVKAGFSFYEARYDETQPWFILEARRMHEMFDKTEITPMLRLINKQFFVDVGINNSGDLRMNLMVIF